MSSVEIPDPGPGGSQITLAPAAYFQGISNLSTYRAGAPQQVVLSAINIPPSEEVGICLGTSATEPPPLENFAPAVAPYQIGALTYAYATVANEGTYFGWMYQITNPGTIRSVGTFVVENGPG